MSDLQLQALFDQDRIRYPSFHFVKLIILSKNILNIHHLKKNKFLLAHNLAQLNRN